MVKKQRDLLPGDKIRVEFGIENNFVTVVVDRIIIIPDQYAGCNIKCHYLDGTTESMWGDPNSDIEVFEQ